MTDSYLYPRDAIIEAKAAGAAAIIEAKAEGAAEERAKIVAWLREQGEYGSERAQAWGETFAAHIEAKEHLK